MYTYSCPDCKDSETVNESHGRDGRVCKKCGSGLLWYRIGLDMSESADKTGFLEPPPVRF